MKTIINTFVFLFLLSAAFAQEMSSASITGSFNGVNVMVSLTPEKSSTKASVDFKVYRYASEGKDELVFSLNDVENREQWVFTDTLSLPDGIYVYRMELYVKGKLTTQESVIVNRFTPGVFPIISNFNTSGVVGKQSVSLKWQTKNGARISNLLLERKNSLEEDFKLIAVLKSTDSIFVDSVTIPNEAYFYRFQMQDRISGEPFQSATVHYVPTFDVLPDAAHQIESEFLNGFPNLTWQSSDEKTRGFYVYKLDPEVGMYKQSSLVIQGDSLGKYQWIDKESNLKLGATYNYYVVSESHSYTKGNPSDTVAVYVPATSLVLSPPQNLMMLQSVDSSYRLVWDVDSTRIDEIAYFEVVRKKPNQNDFVSIPENIIPYHLNYLQIPAPTDGELFAVIAGNGENKSEKSVPFQFNNAFQDDFGPKYLKAEIVDEELWIKWNLPENDKIEGFKLYKWVNESFVVVESLQADVDLLKMKNYQPGENNTFYITAISKEGSESSPSKFISVY